MLFNSYEFIFYYAPIVIGGYFLFGRRGEMANWWLVFASLFFYGYWKVEYLPILLASIAMNYYVSGKILKCARSECNNAKRWLIFGLLCNVGLLGYFKYTDFFLANLNLLGAHFELLHIMLPIGISFFTITQSAYLVDCYRGIVESHSFLRYMLFVTFFPHLLAGPILYHKDIMRQFGNEFLRRVNWENMAGGFALFVIGLAKKVLVADIFVNAVQAGFSNPQDLNLISAWVCAIGYTFQLYFDFSGYSDMAMGLSRMMNIEIPVNFYAPYRATNIIEFWHRWHMSLGTWVKNYLYIPMGGNRNGQLGKMKNLLVSMLIVGFWHGAGWNFVFWGGMHGVMLVINHWWRMRGYNLNKYIAGVLTFIGVTVAWVFFRADSFSLAMQMLAGMCGMHGLAWHLSDISIAGNSFKIVKLIIPAILVFGCPASLDIVHKLKPTWSVAIILSVLFGYTVTRLLSVTEFLYFQF